jgi:hypothetical protein
MSIDNKQSFEDKPILYLTSIDLKVPAFLNNKKTINHLRIFIDRLCNRIAFSKPQTENPDDKILHCHNLPKL